MHRNFLSETLIIIHSLIQTSILFHIHLITRYLKTENTKYKFIQTIPIFGRLRFQLIFANELKHSKVPACIAVNYHPKRISNYFSEFTIISLPLQVILGLCCFRFYIEHTETNRQLKRAIDPLNETITINEKTIVFIINCHIAFNFM